MSAIYTVSQVNQYIKALLDRDRELTALYVRGEISNYKAYPSGHHYFSLKDGEGAIRCVMFKREAMSLRFRPENGMKVIAFGRVAVFPRDGQYQLYCSALTPEGVGDLHLAFEQLKQKLYAEGLFDPAHKKPIPRFPKRIALITSSAGAAVRDMLRILGARWPMAEVFVLPVRVQGVEAPGEICAAIAWANQHQVADLIITGRGGGSMEDLWAFNDENVARTIYHSAIPVISAVGHEPDVTISDFVADLRAATPSNAAELAVPDQAQVSARLGQLRLRLAGGQQGRLRAARKDVERLSRSRVLRDPGALIQDGRQLADRMGERLSAALGAALKERRGALARLGAGLDAMSPLKVLGRGYAMARGERGVVTRAAQSGAGERLDVLFADGTLRCEVVKKEETEPWQAKS